MKKLVDEQYPEGGIMTDYVRYCVLPSDYSIKKSILNKKIALVVYIFVEELTEYCYKYAESMPQYADIYIVTTSKKVEEKCKSLFCNLKNKIEYRNQENRGRDNTALLVTCKDVIESYDYICFVHSKTSSHFKTKIIGDTFRKHCFESLLATPSYVENILLTFDQNEQLGVLVPYPPNFFPYKVIGNEWMNNYKNAQLFIKDRLNLDIELDPENVIGAFGGMFWFKGKAFSTLLSANLGFEDFPKEPLSQIDGLLTHTIERLVPTLAQNDGFYTAYIAPDYYASIYLNNLVIDIKNLKKEQKKI